MHFDKMELGDSARYSVKIAAPHMPLASAIIPQQIPIINP